MTAKTTAERMAAFRKRRKNLGFTRLEIWAHPDDHDAIKETAEKVSLRRKTMSQELMDRLSVQWQRERAETQMTLGKLIDALQEMPEGAEVANLTGAHSYRDYYRDLAFKQREGSRPVSQLLDECREAMNKVFCGYKGGEFVMGAMTPIWVANYGCSGGKLIALHAGGGMETAHDD